MGDFAVGHDAKAYYNSGTHASATWVEIAQAMDVSVDLSVGEADVSTRETNFKLTGRGLVDATINIGYLHTLGTDSVFTALLNMSDLGTFAATQLAIMDQAIATSGAKGLRAFCIATGLPQDQALEEGIKYDFSFKPTRHEESSAIVVPDWYVVP